MTEVEFRTVYGEYRDPLFRFAYRLTGSVDVAEDLVHDCFVSLFRGGFDPTRSSLKTYLYAAMRNLCCKSFRDFRREESGADSDRADPVAAGGPLANLISQETAEAVRRAVAALPLLQREALILFEYEELSLDEVAHVVGADVAAIKSRLYRAREALRKSLSMKEAAR